MAIEDFHERCRRKWISAIEAVAGDKPPACASWCSASTIASALNPFMGMNHNHAHLPGGGGVDIEAVSPSIESGCLELSIRDAAVYLVKPTSLTLEYIEESPGESFLMLELGRLKPSGVYEDIARNREPLLEVDRGAYLDYAIWDRGYLRHDHRGNEVPIPDSARIVTRWLAGKILIVSKGSIWNGSPDTYDGRHNNMTSEQIRQVIERTIAARAS